MGGAQDVNDESLRYQGWCVVVASSVGLFFASSFFMTFCAVTETALRRVLVVPRVHLVRVRRDDPVGRSVDSADGPSGGSAGTDGITGPSLMLAAAAYASLSVLTANLWHLYAVYVVIGLAFAGTSPVVLAGRLGLVRQTPRHGARRGHRECRCREPSSTRW